MTADKPDVLRGIVHFHSETGTEGGLWAFQDERFMHLPPPNQWWCPRCGRMWDKDRKLEEPMPSFTYWIDRDSLSLQQNPRRYIGGYRGFDTPQDGATLIDPVTGLEFPVSEGPSGFDRKWTHDSNERNRVCYDQGHDSWQSPAERFPEGTWSYDGLHVLRDGDHLVIWSKDRAKIMWEGDIKLHQHPLFTEDADGMWIHADQLGIDRGTWSAWFFGEFPADLVPAAKP